MIKSPSKERKYLNSQRNPAYHLIGHKYSETLTGKLEIVLILLNVLFIILPHILYILSRFRILGLYILCSALLTGISDIF
jgi:hypothetical protein